MLDVVWYSLEDAQMFLSNSEYNIRCFHIRGLGPDPSTIYPVYTPGQLKKVVFMYGSVWCAMLMMEVNASFFWVYWWIAN